MAQVTKIYEGKEYTFYPGIDENGKAPVRIDLGFPSEKGQSQRVVAKQVLIEFDDEGIPINIYSKVTNQQFFNEGGIIDSAKKSEDLRMADEEMPQFTQKFGVGIQLSMYNLIMRAGNSANSVAFGYNQHPVFDFETGAFIPDEVTAAPTYDYPHEALPPAPVEPPVDGTTV